MNFINKDVYYYSPGLGGGGGAIRMFINIIVLGPVVRKWVKFNPGLGESLK